MSSNPFEEDDELDDVEKSSIPTSISKASNPFEDEDGGDDVELVEQGTQQIHTEVSTAKNSSQNSSENFNIPKNFEKHKSNPFYGAPDNDVEASSQPASCTNSCVPKEISANAFSAATKINEESMHGTKSWEHDWEHVSSAVKRTISGVSVTCPELVASSILTK
jgi:hypothetical protein